MKKGMKGHARQLMSHHVEKATENMSLADAAALLVSSSLGGLPVVDGENSVIGFLSETDVVGALLKSHAFDTPVRKVMTMGATVIDEFATSNDVIRTLREERIHHLPVTRDGKLVGIISPRDVIRHYLEEVPKLPDAG